MKIAALREKYNSQYPNKMKVIRKGVFWILLNEEAFFMAKYFNMKITKLDKETIKVGFPDASSKARLERFETKNIGYILLHKQPGEEDYTTKTYTNGNYYNSIFSLDSEDYELTKQRILGLSKIGLEEKVAKNFLLKDKLEELYIMLSNRLIKLPRKERYFFREAIERLFMDVLSNVYNYMYNIGNRALLIQAVSDKVLVIREYTRFLYKLGKIKNDNVFLDMGARRVEVLKICKGIKNKIPCPG